MAYISFVHCNFVRYLCTSGEFGVSHWPLQQGSRRIFSESPPTTNFRPKTPANRRCYNAIARNATVLTKNRHSPNNGWHRAARLGKKAPIGLLLAAVGSLQFGIIGALLLLGLLFESLATTSGDLRRVYAGNFFRPTVANSVDSP